MGLANITKLDLEQLFTAPTVVLIGVDTDNHTSFEGTGK
jgi:hypothetical protein